MFRSAWRGMIGGIVVFIVFSLVIPMTAVACGELETEKECVLGTAESINKTGLEMMSVVIIGLVGLFVAMIVIPLAVKVIKGVIAGTGVR